MGKIKEALNRIGIRIKGKPDKYSGTNIVSPRDDLTNTIKDSADNADITSLLDLTQINSFRTIASDRETQYRIYDEMSADSIISSALEMYSDDATQYNSKGEVIWAESEDTDVAAFANRLIKVLDLNESAWSHIYSMVKYGDLYIRIYRDTDEDDDLNNEDTLKTSPDIIVDKPKKGMDLEEYVEAIPNPAEIFDLTERGKTVGFVKVPKEDANPTDRRYSYQYKITVDDKTVIESADRYIHIALTNNVDRFPDELEVTEEDSGKVVKYRIKRGKSILHDIYKSYKELSLMEDSLLLNRVTRSSIIRILQVEVGDMPKAQSREVLKRIKTLIEQHNYMDKNDGSYTSMAAPGPIDNVIYVPTHDGKGSISASNLGGDVDVKSIADIDYYKNKLYGGLKIPKQFLGDDMEGSGLSAGTSLTKLDARYARTIKRIQNAYIAGITNLINIYALHKGLEDHVNNFTIKMVSPSTVEDSERDETFASRMDIAGTFIDLISDPDSYDNKTRKAILMHFVSNYFNEPDLAEILENDKTVDEVPDKDNENESEGDTNFDTDFNFDSGDDFGSDIDFDSELEPNEDNFEEEVPEETGITDNEEFGDFEDEF